MDIKSLKNFITIAENGSISKAAEQLHISQPPLTKQMQALEDELGVTLFYRSSKGILLTQKGEMLYERALQLLSLNDTIVNEIKSNNEEVIRIGVISSAMQYALTLFKAYHECCSEQSFAIKESNTFDLLKMTEQNRVDMAVIRTPFDTRKDIQYIKMLDDELVTFGKRELFPDNLENLTLRDLGRTPLITVRRWQNHIVNSKDDVGRKLFFKYICDDNRTAYSLAKRGLGIAILPRSVLDPYFDRKQFTSKNFTGSNFHTSLYLIYNTSTSLKKSHKEFMDFVKSYTGIAR